MLLFLKQSIYSDLERLPNFSLKFGNSPSTETLDYVLLDGHNMDLDEVSFAVIPINQNNIIPFSLFS